LFTERFNPIAANLMLVKSRERFPLLAGGTDFSQWLLVLRMITWLVAAAFTAARS
jgi:hypothetical protein